jgi:hypothetical protein
VPACYAATCLLRCHLLATPSLARYVTSLSLHRRLSLCCWPEFTVHYRPAPTLLACLFIAFTVIISACHRHRPVIVTAVSSANPLVSAELLYVSF